MNKYINIFIWLVLLSAMGMIITVFYWLYAPYNPITFKTKTAKVLDKVVTNGGYIRFEIDYCKENNLLPQIERMFVDGIVYTVPMTLATGNPKGCQKQIIFIYVPKALPPATYHIRTIYRYQVNPIRVIDIINDTESFKVVPKPTSIGL